MNQSTSSILLKSLIVMTLRVFDVDVGVAEADEKASSASAAGRRVKFAKVCVKLINETEPVLFCVA